MKYSLFTSMFYIFQAAHSDIESHGQLIKTVVELCDKYSRRCYKQRNQQFLNNTYRQRHSIRHQSRVSSYFTLIAIYIKCFKNFQQLL